MEVFFSYNCIEVENETQILPLYYIIFTLNVKYNFSAIISVTRYRV